MVHCYCLTNTEPMSLKAHYYYVIVLYRAKLMTCVLAKFWVTRML